jgi:MOSC domain-containing protein YiiM
MRIVSVNVGQVREVEWKGKTVPTGIFKSPVAGRVAVRKHNLEGDRQGDPSVHGGPTKAVYAYPVEHYDFWRGELPDAELGYGAFGENLTTEGLDEEAVAIGDEYRVGTAKLVVTEPRMPCLKLGIRFGRADMVKRFLESQRTGFYFGVVEEGDVEAGDGLELLAKHPAGLTVSEVTRLYSTEKDNEELLRKAIAVEVLPEKWRGHFEEQLEKIQE